MLRPSAFSAFTTLLFALLLIAPLSSFETHQATNQDELFKLIGDGDDSIMALGDEVIVAEGDYICGPCYVSYRMYELFNLYGTVRCASDDHGCKLSGEGSRSVIDVSGTSGGTLVLRSFSIHRGNFHYGGGGLRMRHHRRRGPGILQGHSNTFMVDGEERQPAERGQGKIEMSQRRTSGN